MTESAAVSASPRDIVERFIRAAAGDEREDMLDLYAPDVLIEMPFAPPSVPRRSEGREALRARLEGVAGLWQVEKIDHVVLHQTSDPEVIVAEYDLHRRVAATGRSYPSTYIMVIRVRDGRIISSRDYADPLASVQALGRIPELVSALTEEETGRARVAERLRRTVETMDTGAFAELLAPDAVYEVPFAPPSTPVHIEGREAVMAHLAEAADRGRGLGIEEVSSTVHLGADPELVVIELQVSGTSPVTGRRYRFDSSIGVVRVQKGRIVSWRDHPNASAAEALAG